MNSRERRVDIDASVLEKLLEWYAPDDRDFALEEIVRVVRARRVRRRTGRYRLDFSHDEPPTEPDGSVDLGDRVTRKVNVDEIAALVKKSKKPPR